MLSYTYVSQLGIDVALMCKSIKNTMLFNGFDSKWWKTAGVSRLLKDILDAVVPSAPPSHMLKEMLKNSRFLHDCGALCATNTMICNVFAQFRSPVVPNAHLMMRGIVFLLKNTMVLQLGLCQAIFSKTISNANAQKPNIFPWFCMPMCPSWASMSLWCAKVSKTRCFSMVSIANDEKPQVFQDFSKIFWTQ